MPTSSLPEWFTEEVRECIHGLQPAWRTQRNVAWRLRGCGLFEAGDALYNLSSHEFGRVMETAYLSTPTKYVRS